MDVDEPLRKFLESTGWSCDDLLAKIQKIKSNQHPSSQLQGNSAESVRELEECIVDSTVHIHEETSDLKPNENHIPVDYVSVELNKRNEDFSDTDEDEAEVLVTNSNIIDEIIEDIAFDEGTEKGKSSKGGMLVPQTPSPVNLLNSETGEITEVKIIELNEDDEDVKFEDECHGIDFLTPEKMEELDKLSRELTYSEDTPQEIERGAQTISPDSIALGKRTVDIGVKQIPTNQSKKNRSQHFSIPVENIDKDIIEITSDSEEIDTNKTTVSHRGLIIGETNEHSNHDSSVSDLTLEREHKEIKESIIIETEIKKENSLLNDVDKNTIRNNLPDKRTESSDCSQQNNKHNSEQTSTPYNSFQFLSSNINTKLIVTSNIKLKEATEKLLVIGNKGNLTKNPTVRDFYSISTYKEQNEVIPDFSILPQNKGLRNEKINVLTHMNDDVTSRNKMVSENYPVYKKSKEFQTNTILDLGIDKSSTTDSSIKQSFLIDNSQMPIVDFSEDKSETTVPLPPITIVESLSEDEKSLNSETNMENDVPPILDDIRNNLRMQLSCLRTKKKGTFLEKLGAGRINRVEEHASSSDSYPKKVKHLEIENATVTSHTISETGCENLDVTDTVIEPAIKILQNIGEIQNNSSQCVDNSQHLNDDYISSVQSENVDELYTQTNELGFVISSVQGGIEFEELDNGTNKTETEQAEINSSEHATGVFEEIRKIIRKQKLNNVAPETSNVKSNSNDYKNTNSGFSDDGILMEKHNSFLSSADNSQSSFNFEESDQNTENSPFVSNTLDEFLTTENAKLNISYNVPKCGAEEGLKESYDDTPLVVKKVENLEGMFGRKPRKMQTIKAKTLAQKRKLLERQRQKEWKKRRMLIEEKIRNIKEDQRSFILFEDKKIWVKSFSVPGKCIAVVDCLNPYNEKKDMFPNGGKRKLSLLADSKQIKLKYLPGPLSKKAKLQLTGNAEWETLTKTLPKLFVEITPSVGTPIPINIRHHLPYNDCELTNERINFALSVVRSRNGQNPPEEKFVFPVKYRNNQEQIVVRKRKSPLLSAKVDMNSSNGGLFSDSSDDTIKDVIDRLLNYVEIKELAPKLIKEEVIISEVDNKGEENHSPVNDNINIIRKPQKKKSRIDHELLRLNCKVVNVEVEEQEDAICNKAFCKLGCICKSLKCESILNLHCQKYHCMFNCTCPKEKAVVYDHKLTLSAGTNILSNETVSRIEDEAKKHLAKVEKEFTQTVIHTNDKTIVIGLGTRYKARRNTKIPMKYSDFIDGDKKLDKTLEKNITNQGMLRNCKVHLMKMNFSKILPYCLVHELYDCHCKGKVSYSMTSEENITDRRACKVILGKKQKLCKSDSNDQKSKNPSQTSSDSRQNFSAEVSPDSSSSRPLRTIKKPKLDENFDYSHADTIMCSDSTDCARTRAIDKNSIKKEHADVTTIYNDFIHNIKESDMLLYKLSRTNNSQVLREADILKIHIIKESLVVHNKMKLKINHKKKQITEVPEASANSSTKQFPSLDGVMQRRKKVVTAVKNKEDLRPVFDGEIIINETSMELLSRMGPRHVADGYARLLPWNNLIQSFHGNKINIWCMKNQSSKLMMNKAEYNNPPKNYEDIRLTENRTMIITCILENKLPSGHDHNNISFILKETKDNFEICGLCAKNINPKTEVAPSLGNDLQSTDNKETTFSHRDMCGKQWTLSMEKRKFKLQELVEEGLRNVGDTSVENTKLYMWAALPEIYRVCKWRVIYLNSDFTYLLFKNINYSIKYTDLLSTGMIAKENDYTVMLRNIEMQQHYDHKVFGIYFDPHYQDRLFVGPYFRTYTDNDVETLRYSNGKLVCTESFNRMRGEGDYKCGHWLIERPYQNAAGSTIDLTEDIEEDSLSSIKDSSHIFLHNNQEVKIIDTAPKSPSEFNRYIITNIPHFGYLGAYQHQNSEIDIQWPFEKKLLRFKDTKNAIDFLQKRFSSLLVSVPQTFKIVALILTSIDLQNTQPIKSDVLNGHHICGDFGCHSISDLTEENCKAKTGFNKEDIVKSFLIKRQGVIRERARQLASLVKFPENIESNLNSIVTKAATAIKNLHEKNKQLVNEKSRLLLEKRSNASKAFTLISELPPQEKYVESKKLMSVMNFTEPIEIVDSDEEKDVKSFGFRSNTKQQSLLKPLLRVPITGNQAVLFRGELPESSNFKTNNTAKYIQGVKLVRNNSGKLVLMPDKSPIKKPQISPGMKVTIKNNKIQSIRTDDKVGDSSKNVKLEVKRTLVKLDSQTDPLHTKNNSTNENSRDSSTAVIDLCDEEYVKENSDNNTLNSNPTLETSTCDL